MFQGKIKRKVIWSFFFQVPPRLPFPSVSQHFDSPRLQAHYVDIIRLVYWRKVWYYGLCIYI